jgi:hypothetical protein
VTPSPYRICEPPRRPAPEPDPTPAFLVFAVVVAVSIVIAFHQRPPAGAPSVFAREESPSSMGGHARATHSR